VSLGKGEIGVHQIDQQSWFLRQCPSRSRALACSAVSGWAAEVPDTVRLSLNIRAACGWLRCTLGNSFDAAYDIFYGRSGDDDSGQSRMAFPEVDCPRWAGKFMARKEHSMMPPNCPRRQREQIGREAQRRRQAGPPAIHRFTLPCTTSLEIPWIWTISLEASAS